MKKKLGILCVAVIAAVAVVCTCIHPGKTETVRLNEVTHSVFYAPQYVAIEEGYFADEGIDLTLITGFGADKVLTARRISGLWGRRQPSTRTSREPQTRL